MITIDDLLRLENEYIHTDASLNIKINNDDNLREYVQSTTDNILNNETLFDYDVNKNLIKEYLELVKHDIKTSSFPKYNVKISKEEEDKSKERSIKINYLGYMLGNVYWNSQIKYLRMQIPIEKLIIGGVRVRLFNEALTEAETRYLFHDIKNENSFATTTLMINLFELGLKTTTRRVLLDKLLIDLKNKGIECDLLNRVNIGDPTLNEEGDVLKRIFDFLEINKIIVNMKKDYKEILRLIIEKSYEKPITLNSLFYNKVFKELCDETWYQFMRILFVDLDLRNNIAHCNFDYNYYSINITAVIFQLFHMMARGFIYKR
jgi:hypothetical protein